MAKTETTVKSYFYTVTSPNGGTVTDASGKLNKTVEAGDQVTVQAPSDSLTCDDDDAVIYKANFKSPLLALRLLGQGENELPAGYTRVEFLKGAGRQWLETNLWLTPQHDYDTTFAELDGDQAWGQEGDGFNQTMHVYRTEGVLRAQSTYNNRLQALHFNYNGEYATLRKRGLTYTLGDQTNTAQGFDFQQPDFDNANVKFCRLFTYLGNLNYHIAKGKWYSQKVWLEGKLVQDLYPALDVTGTPCMFDTVTRTPFYNSGTGDFTYPGSETASAQATTYNLRALRRPRMYAQMTEHGIRRLYHVPKGYNGTPEEYAAEHGFKLLVETPVPEEGYWAPQWHEREDCIELEWVETEPPTDSLGDNGTLMQGGTSNTSPETNS